MLTYHSVSGILSLNFVELLRLRTRSQSSFDELVKKYNNYDVPYTYAKPQVIQLSKYRYRITKQNNFSQPITHCNRLNNWTLTFMREKPVLRHIDVFCRRKIEKVAEPKFRIRTSSSRTSITFQTEQFWNPSQFNMKSSTSSCYPFHRLNSNKRINHYC